MGQKFPKKVGKNLALCQLHPCRDAHLDLSDSKPFLPEVGLMFCVLGGHSQHLSQYCVSPPSVLMLGT